jgi:4-amino-4-deoxy-L-arabinose transferase-like glycosyltransferase
MPASESHLHKIDILLLSLILALGIFLRLPPHTFATDGPLHSIAAAHPGSKMQGVGFDEGMYRGYLITLIDGGLGAYPQIVEHYIELQQRVQRSVLPPVRFLYLFCGYLWHQLFGSEPLAALKDVSAVVTMLTLFASTVFAWRLRGRTWALAIAALMAVAPTQLHMSQHALIDGFFAFWALLCLWFFWENLRAPRHWLWLSGYILALALLVLTKENAFFVWVALVVLIVANRWLNFGTATRELVLATILGPLIGVVILALFAGGVSNLVAAYQAFAIKAPQFSYAIITGDGPWYRYLVDLFLVSPIILILAFGTLFRLDREMKPELFMSIFIAASYLLMCNVKYGMNLRYANMWDMPLRFLAFSQIVAMASWAKSYRTAIIATAVVVLAAIEFHQYIVLAVRYPLYELITHDLLQALQILKSP